MLGARDQQISSDEPGHPESRRNRSGPQTHLSAQLIECPQQNSLPDFPQGVKVKVNIMVRGENPRQHFAGLK